VAEDAILEREEALAMHWMVADLVAEVRVIRALLEDDDGEEEE